jgi:hypothetical protein
MPVTREQFAENLRRGTEAVRKCTERYCWNELPSQEMYFVHERFFPDHAKPQTDRRIPRFADEVVMALWHDGKVPHWIDITPYEVAGDVLYFELRCCGTFTSEDLHLYHKKEGYPPFHIFGPIQPVEYRSLEEDGKFDLHCYRDRKPKN